MYLGVMLCWEAVSAKICLESKHIYQSPGLVLYCKSDALKVLLKVLEIQFESEVL